MARNRRHNTWLFSFTDTAFLLLLVYTQFGRLNADTGHVAEMRLPVPSVVKNSELVSRKMDNDYCQLLVEKHSEKPYRLVRITGGSEVSRSTSMSLADLDGAISAMRSESKGQPRPVVVPLPESFSSDLLQGSSLVSKIWNEEGSAVVHTQDQIIHAQRTPGDRS
jgi:hypothetical protein